MAGHGRGSSQQLEQDQDSDMTVTQRRVRAADPSGPEDRASAYPRRTTDDTLTPVTEPGIKYTCDICEDLSVWLC
jgi:hypothetical protein